MNRAREFVNKALWYVGNNGHWQTVSELLSLAIGEIAELEQAAAAALLPKAELVVADLVEHTEGRNP